MADPYLPGNGKACPACALRREAEDKAAVLRPEIPCNCCGGTGRIALSTREIIAAACAWAAANYWPSFDQRNGL